MQVNEESKPSDRWVAITPHDSTNLADTTRGIYVGTGGDITAVMDTGDSVLFSNIPTGFILPIRAKRINATATTASDLVGLY